MAETSEEAGDGVPSSIMRRRQRTNTFFVDEATFDDNSVIWVPPSALENLQMFRGDTVLVRGNVRKETVLIVLADDTLSEGSARLTRIVRRNLSLRFGDLVSIYACPEIKYANRVAVLPYADTIEGLTGSLFENFLAPYFREQYRPVYRGDDFVCRSGNYQVEFQVIEVDPAGYGLVAEDTVIHVEGEPLTRDLSSHDVVGYREVGGYQKQLAQLREMVELPLRHPQLYSRLGIKPLRGILLHGPPGTGKSLVAQALANETGASLFIASAAELLTKKSPHGELESTFQSAITMAKHSPTIIVIDNIDLIAPNRATTKGGDTQYATFATLMSRMDSLNTIFNIMAIAITNDVNLVDSALRRFGRFGFKVYFDFPTEAERKEILLVRTKLMALASDVDMDNIARNTENYSGSDLNALCYVASMRQIRSKLVLIDIEDTSVDAEVLDSLQVTAEDFDSALTFMDSR